MSGRLKAVMERLRAEVGSVPLDRACLERLAFMVDYEHFLTFGCVITQAAWCMGASGPALAEDEAEREPNAAADTLGPEERLTVERVMARWADDPAGLEQWLREDEFLAQFAEGERIDSARFVDPLADSAAQTAVMMDRELHASVRRARAQVRPRGAQREGIAR